MEVERKNQSGASAVEFAIVLPILVLLVFGIIEFSVALYDKAMITNASREGARAGIVFRVPPVADEEITEEITNVVKSYLGNSLITFGGPATATTTVTRNGSNPGDELKVTVKYNYTFLIIPNFITSLSGGINMMAETVMRME
jgi:Flp pilus assembly protein TadG